MNNFQELDQKKLIETRDRFVQHGQRRWQQLLAAYTGSQADRLRLLPLLFHINHPALPGYLSADVSCGIPDYSPSKEILHIARAVAPSFSYRSRAFRAFDILGLYLMGSAGSLGQAHKSDIDMWLIVADNLAASKRNLLQRKAAEISAWYADSGIELSVYVVAENTFRAGPGGAPELSEQIGRQMLLDEFYRSAIYLAGRWLLWWLVPPDSDYSEVAQRLLAQRHIQPGQWLDLGEVAHIPAEEFLQTALHQLHKATSSPFKAVVKLCLIEYYARQQSPSALLSFQLKQGI